MEKPDSTETTAWLRVLRPAVLPRLGRIQHVLFDFDGTLSVLRQGWEDVMIPLMIEMICGALPGSPAVEEEVRTYIDRSSGILTIKQMQWLSESVQRHGLAGPVRTAGEYKALYLERLMVSVRARKARLEAGESPPEDNMMRGAAAFLAGLRAHSARLYLASGTDHGDVVNEASALGLLPFFNGGVYGALDHTEDHAKERVIQRILEENHIDGDRLLVIGDGPVEIREGATRGAITLGLASNELARAGWNPHKIERLVNAGADLLAPDFTQAEDLLAFLFEPDPVQYRAGMA